MNNLYDVDRSYSGRLIPGAMGHRAPLAPVRDCAGRKYRSTYLVITGIVPVITRLRVVGGRS